MWPVPLVVLGLLFVISATRRVMAQREVAEIGSERVDADTEPRDEDEASCSAHTPRHRTLSIGR